MSRTHVSHLVVVAAAVLLVLGAIAVAPEFVHAEDSAASGAVGPEGFRASKGPSNENVPGIPLLAIGYGALGVLVFGFLYKMIRGQIAMRRKLQQLETSIAGADSVAKD